MPVLHPRQLGPPAAVNPDNAGSTSPALIAVPIGVVLVILTILLIWIFVNRKDTGQNKPQSDGKLHRLSLLTAIPLLSLTLSLPSFVRPDVEQLPVYEPRPAGSKTCPPAYGQQSTIFSAEENGVQESDEADLGVQGPCLPSPPPVAATAGQQPS